MLEQGIQYRHSLLQTKKDFGRQHFKSKWLTLDHAFFLKLHVIIDLTTAKHLQCRPELSEPKHTRKTRLLRTHIRVQKSADARLVRRISMYELAHCFRFVDLSLFF